MVTEHCYSLFEFTLCFVPLDPDSTKLFGFPEFLTALALMILAWTISDVRYRFRIRTAPLPLQGIAFSVTAIVGTFTLLTDLWIAEQWLVPKCGFLTPSIWQAFLGGLFFLTLLVWLWFALIRPPVYGKWNSKRYGQTLYYYILKGSQANLSIVADELVRSVKPLINHATDWTHTKINPATDESYNTLPQVSGYADDILLLIADKRLCRVIVELSPHTAQAVFDEVRRTEKYGIRIGVFAKNIVNEALINKDSFLFHEVEEGYESGLIGYLKPLSQAMFSHHKMVETIGTYLDPDFESMERWDAVQLEAYCRIVLMTFRDYVDNALWNHSFVLYRAMQNIRFAVSDLYRINGINGAAWDSKELAKLQVVVKFFQDAIVTLDRGEVPRQILGRSGPETFYDYLAKMICDVISSASCVRSPPGLCWSVQYNAIWGRLFGYEENQGSAIKVVQYKVRRKIYDEIVRMERFPNFEGAGFLSFCLNVIGFDLGRPPHHRSIKALQSALLSWTKKNFSWLDSRNPRVASACLPDRVRYDAENCRLVKAYPLNTLDESKFDYLELNPLDADRGVSG